MITITHLLSLKFDNANNQVFFYTKRDGKYYYGTDNNSFSEESINDMVKRKKLFKLRQPIEIDGNDETLWSSFTKVWVGSMERPIFSRAVGKFEEIIET